MQIDTQKTHLKNLQQGTKKKEKKISIGLKKMDTFQSWQKHNQL